MIRRLSLLLAFVVVNTAAAQDFTTSSSIVDDEYRFRLDPPPKPWRLMPEAEIRQLVPDALAGAVEPTGIYGVVVAEEAPGVRVDDYARFLIENMPIEEKNVVSFDTIDFHGHDGVRYRVTGNVSGMRMQFINTVFRNGDFVFQLTTWGATVLRPDVFEPFVDAFAILDGEVTGRSNTAPVSDDDGVGWRVRDGAFESAVYRLRVEPEEGWRVAIGAELWGMNPDAEVGLVHEGPDVYVAVIAERAVGVDHTSFVEHVLSTVDPAFREIESDTRAMIGGHDLELRRFRTDGEPSIELLKGAFFQGDLCYQVIAWYMADLAPQTMPLVPEAFAAIDFLDDEALDALSDELSAAPDVQNAVGQTFALRGGRYMDFEHGFSWTKPEGYWRVNAGEEARLQNPDASLTLEEPGLGLYGLVIAEQVPAIESTEYHEAVLGMIFGPNHPCVSQTPSAMRTQGGQIALQTDVAVGGNGIELTYRIATVVHDDRAVQLLLFGAPGNVSASESELDAAVAGIRFQDDLRQITRAEDGVTDMRFGYSMQPPLTGAWKDRDITPAAMRSLGSIRQWSNGSQTVLVMCLCAMQEGQDPTWFQGFVDEMLQDRMGSALGADSSESEERVLHGLPCRYRTWEDGAGILHCWQVFRGRTFYAIMVSEDGPGPRDASLEKMVEGFALVE